jgi:SHS2 domain-containing protein
MPFRFLDHTADVQVECRAATFTALLETSADSLYAVTLRERHDRSDRERTIAVAGANREEILIRWLQELIFLLDIDHFVATQFEFEKADDQHVAVHAHGYACSREERAEEVKSATYHELVVQQNDDGFLARFILDL